MQENVSNDSLSDHERGVLCQAAPQRILDVLQQKGFAMQNQTEERRAIWTLVQGGGGSHQPPAPHPTPSGGGHQPPAPQPTPGGENDADQGGEEEEEQQEGRRNRRIKTIINFLLKILYIH